MDLSERNYIKKNMIVNSREGLPTLILDDKDNAQLATLMQLTSGRFEAFLYDCDGTLADNMSAHKASYVQAAAQYGFDLDPAIIDELAGWPTAQVVAEIGRRYNVTLDALSFSQLKGEIFMKDIGQTKPIPFVMAHLLAHVGTRKIGVVSGGRRPTVERTLQVLGIDHLIDTLVCAGDTEKGKPYPDPFLKAASALNVDPAKCVVFEDGAAGVEAAIAADMQWIRIDKI
jgi:HAD superfamily hydrolase (TIGR01509 family)